MGAASQRHAKRKRGDGATTVYVCVCVGRDPHTARFISTRSVDSFSAREPEMYGMALASAAPPACLPYGRAGWREWT